MTAASTMTLTEPSSSTHNNNGSGCCASASHNFYLTGKRFAALAACLGAVWILALLAASEDGAIRIPSYLLPSRFVSVPSSSSNDDGTATTTTTTLPSATTTTACTLDDGGGGTVTTTALRKQQQQLRQQPNENADDEHDDGPATKLVEYGDYVYSFGDWDGAPVVLEEFRLVFFTTAKVACTTWKQLFRRMMGLKGWNTEEYGKLLPWNPELNGLKYLYDYDRDAADAIMTSPNWTRAIFVREPKQRFLSAYMDKALKNKDYIQHQCCSYTGKCVDAAKRSPAGFLKLAKWCPNAHWMPQARRMEPKYWKYVNFVGHQETVADDAERLLRRVGAWTKYGASGWGDDGTDAVFRVGAGGQGRQHATNASDVDKMRLYIDADLESQLDEFYADDYAHPVLNITKIRLY